MTYLQDWNSFMIVQDVMCLYMTKRVKILYETVQKNLMYFSVRP